MIKRSLAAILLFAGTAAAQYVPTWWWEGSNPILVQGKPSNNFAIANVGQLKWVATQAANHLNAKLPGGAQSTVNNLVATLTPVIGGSYTPQQLADLRAANYKPLNLGQLKFVALPFYQRLRNVGYSTNANLKANGYSPLWTGDDPWGSVPVSENYKPVTIGQLKLVFSFDIVDSDGNGILDYQEGIYPAVNSTRDTDGDGVADIIDAYPNDSARSASLVLNSNDHIAPTIAITQPVGVTLQ
jgi:hypothetical protein